MKRLLLFFVSLTLVLSLVSCDLSVLNTSQTPSTDVSETTVSSNDNSHTLPDGDGSFDYETVPSFSGSPYVAVNGNIPFFKESELTSNSYEDYSPLDELGRCGVTMACIGIDLMPTEERGSIGSVKPSGWQTVKYDVVDGKYLYNRCHLIGFQLTGENANTRNLITGTRYLNIQGMLPFENMVADYIKETENHVLYRATPVFVGAELVARGVLIEGYSIEDNGDGICFNVFAYNVQPGIAIDYQNGNSTLIPESETSDPSEPSDSDDELYIVNTNTKKFHIPSCSSASDIAEDNRLEYRGDRDSLIEDGYSPCGRCKP